MSKSISRALGLPTEYKGLKIYPVKIVDSDEFYNLVECLAIPKNDFQEPEIIRMSYLEFLLAMAQHQEGYEVIRKLLLLYAMIFRTDNIDIEVDDRNMVFMVVDGIKLHEMDFDKIKSIIGEQNLVDLEDELMDLETKNEIREAEKFLARKKKEKGANLEQQIIAYHCAMGTSYEEIMQLTIFQFHRGLVRADYIQNAQALNQARYSGMVEFKDEKSLPHWLDNIEEAGKHSDSIISLEEMKKKAGEAGLAQ